MKKKISFQMENRFMNLALWEMIGNGELTYAEFAIYSIMRAHAFKKGNTRNLCKIDHKFIAKLAGNNPRKVLEKIKSLEKKKLLKPIYNIQYKGKMIEMDSYEEARSKFGLIHIKFKNYIVKSVPGELRKIKEYKSERLQK